MSAPAESILPVPSQALSPEEAARFLLPFGVGAPERTETLLSYDWEGGAFRRIVRCRYGAGDLVLKVRREEELPLSRLVSQCTFSEYLAKNGVRTARLLPVLSCGEGRSGESFAAELPMEGGPALVTVERFCGGQLTVVTPDLAEAMGELLARAHAFFCGIPVLLCGYGYALAADAGGKVAFASSVSPCCFELEREQEFHLVETRRRGFSKTRRKEF